MIRKFCDACRGEIFYPRGYRLWIERPEGVTDEAAYVLQVDLCDRCAAAVHDVVNPKEAVA